MFSNVSRFFAQFLDPSLILICLFLASTLLAIVRRRRSATATLLLALALTGLAAWKPFPQLLIRPLEERFPLWRDSGANVAGIVVLGGALNPDLASWRPGSGFSSSSGRLTESGLLARRFPAAKILLSGGGETNTEAEQSGLLLTQLGVEPDRIIVEARSRTTAENAKFSCELGARKAGERWLLVTSAWHMPRAVGAFRAAEFDVEAYPVDFRAMASAPWFDLGAGLELLRIAIKEYVGLVAYRIAGRTLELVPSPNGSTSGAGPAGKCGNRSGRLLNQPNS